MSAPHYRSAIESAAARLRAEVLDRPAGALLGSEDALQELLGVSKPTMRQAARLVEREGLLRVKRGNNGGYFGARPDPASVEAAVSSYLEALDAAPGDLTTIASLLWIEVVRRAAALKTDAARALAQRFRNKLKSVPDSVGIADLFALDEKIRREIFALIKSPYVELIFNVNADFARRRLAQPPASQDDTPEHAAFVTAWRKAKLTEIEAIADGDEELAIIGARRERDLVHRRLWR